MIRNPLGLRLDPDRPVREQIHEAARMARKAWCWTRSAICRRNDWATLAGATSDTY